MKNSACLLVCMLALTLAVAVTATAQDQPPLIHAGIVNAKATKLPRPDYPEELRIAGIGGRVSISIVIDEMGKVVSADHHFRIDPAQPSQAEPPHPLLVEAAREASLKARFPPTEMNGQKVSIAGELVYNFGRRVPIEGFGGGTSKILNGRAIKLPNPNYPPGAKAAGASGTVTVEVVINEDGSLESAKAIAGHPLLRSAAVDAARRAKFSPALENGAPTKVTGVIVYNFVLPARNR